MAVNEPIDHYYRLEGKIGEAEKNLRQEITARIDNLEQECFRKSEITHYATKFLVGSIMVAVFVALCGAYMVITPIFIDSKNSRLNETVNQILEIVKSNSR